MAKMTNKRLQLVKRCFRSLEFPRFSRLMNVTISYRLKQCLREPDLHCKLLSVTCSNILSEAGNVMEWSSSMLLHESHSPEPNKNPGYKTLWELYSWYGVTLMNVNNRSNFVLT